MLQFSLFLLLPRYDLRVSRDHRVSEPPLDRSLLEVDIASERHDQLQRSFQLNLSSIPNFRFLTAGLLLVAVYLHNQLIGDPADNERLPLFAGVLTAYTLVAWAVLRHSGRNTRRSPFRTTFLALDVLILAWSIHLTGAESSWLILMLLLRTADQMSSGFKRCLIFAHWTTVAYLGVLLWSQLIDGRPMPWTVEAVKLFLLYVANIYLAFTARFFDLRRRLTLDWVELTRNLAEGIQQQAVELEEERVKAQAASRAKSNFLANMSHELRTPMNAVMGLADLLALHRLEKTQRQRANLLRDSAADLQAVIENLLDFSQIEAEELALEPKDSDVREVVNGVVKRLRPRAEAKDLLLETKVDSVVPQRLLLDPLRVRQVLLHLVDNAIKFTDHGQVAVRIRADSVTDGAVALRVEIEDSGVGIAQKDLPRLFDPFTQVDSSLTREQGGTGLGLPICKRLVEMMGGSIHARSRLGRGTTVWFTLTCRRSSQKAIEEVIPNDTLEADRARVLVVEDNPVNQEVVGSMLSGLGFEVSKAENGAEALQVLERMQFDLVLMDCQMPTMDGYRATEEIRRREGDGRHTPIVALTAHAMEGDRERCLAAGMDDYLAKPLNLERLGETLGRWIRL